MYDERYAARNPYVTLPDPLISIAADGPAAEVFRASPEEPWRVIRTRWRVAGLVGGPVEGGGRSAGYFTGATGLTIYKGDAFGPDYVGDAFVGDAGGNLVHHKHIHTGPDGIEPVAERPADEKKIEFLASTDNWFRPVDFANAPDGCLYVCDMYRETIEHPWSLPPQIKQYLDLNSGNDRGRIYRFAPDGYKLRPPPKLGGASTAELVALLEHPNGWHRETASRLLYERQDPAAVPLLRSLVLESHAPLAAMHALWALDGLGVLRAADVTAGVRSRDPGVRVQAVRLSEKFAREDKADADRDALWAAVAACAKDPDARVRYQLAFTLGEWDADERPPILARLLRSAPQSKWMRAAVLSSVGNDAGAVFDQLKADGAFCASAEGRTFLEPLVRTIGQMPGGDGARRDVAAYASGTTDPVLKFTLAGALAEAIASRHGSVDALADLGTCVKSAAACAGDPKAPPAARAAAIPLLAYERYDDAGPVLRSVLANRSSPTAAAAALATLDHFDDPRVATDLLAAWPSLSPRLRTDVISTLLKRPARAAALLAAIEKTQVQPTDIDAAQANALRHHPDAQVRQAAERLLPPPPSRESVLAAFRAALDLSGDAARGRKIYESRCISCHRAAGEGNAVGPDFVTIKNSGREKLLLNILDPNREVAPQYVAFLIETRDGQSLLGILASDTPAALTVRQAYGRETVVPRANIKRMTSQGKSLMPEGLEEGLKPQDAADLMTFIEGVK